MRDLGTLGFEGYGNPIKDVNLMIDKVGKKLHTKYKYVGRHGVPLPDASRRLKELSFVTINQYCCGTGSNVVKDKRGDSGGNLK